ncbi:MAG: ArsR/SmtB family transcription factor [Thermoproteus sp.]
MDIFEALANPLRRRILELLADRPRLYSELMDALSVDSPTLAFHLKRLDGLVEKDEKGFYRLTQMGARALEVVRSLQAEGGGQAKGPEPPLVLGDRMVAKINKELLEYAKRQGRKLVVQDSAIVEIADDVDPGLFMDVVESIRDVALVKAPKGLRPYVELKAKDVGLIGEGGLAHLLTEGVSLLGSVLRLGAFKGIRKAEKVVYDGPFAHGRSLAVEAEGSKIEIRPGAGRARALCGDEEDFEIGPGRVEADGCEVVLEVGELDELKIVVEGGKVEVEGIQFGKADLDVEGGVVELKAELGKSEVVADVEGGLLSAELGYRPFEGEASVGLKVSGGMAKIALKLPEEVGLLTSSNSAGGYVKLPQNKPGGKGVVKVSVDAFGGFVEVAAQ